MAKAHIVGEPGKSLTEFLDGAKLTNTFISPDLPKVLEKKPEFVLLIGAAALKQVDPKAKITQLRGRFFEKDGVQYFPTISPGITFREPEKAVLIQNDLKFFRKSIKAGRVIEEKKGNYQLVNTWDDFEKLIQLLQDPEVDGISYDLETTGLNPWAPDADIICVGLGTGDAEYVVPIAHREGFIKTRSQRELAMEILCQALEGKRLTAHNGKFDSLYTLVRYKQRVRFHDDTMLAHFLLDENQPQGLKHLSSVYLGAPEYDVDKKTKTGHASLDKVARYCALDVYYTRKLKIKFIKRLKEDPALYKLYRHLMMPAMNCFVDIEERGVYVEMDRLDQAEEAIKGILAEVMQELDKFKTGINWGSTQQLGRYLYDELKLPILERTDTGAPSSSESVMLRLKAHHPVAELVLKYREAKKLLSSFINSWRGKIVDSRLHPSFKLIGAVTGRLSCVEPNLQQVPRDKRIRTLIGAPEDWVLVEADQSQVELRLAAAYSGCPVMKMLFQTNQDIHTATGQLVSGKTELTKEERKKAKAVNFGFLYGMGWFKFIEYARDKYDAHFTEKQAKDIRRRFFEKYVGLSPWHDRQRRIVKMNGYVRSLCGRIRHLPDIYSDEQGKVAQAERQAINSPVQGFGSDLIMMAVIEISEKLDMERFRIVGTVHDALLMEIRKDYLEEALPLVKATMERPKLLDKLGVRLNIPLVAEVAVGNWGDGKEWHPNEA